MKHAAQSVPIVHIPHPALRAVATSCLEVDTKLITLCEQLAATLSQTRNPRGVGLAAPQIAVSRRVFATQLDQKISLYINPVITSHSKEFVFGPDKEEPRLEGCLSIPKIYGPVPRYQWIELAYDSVVGSRLEKNEIRLDDFAARVAQHELDHLDGRLFIDYSLTFDLPIYSENPETEELEVLSSDLLIALGAVLV